MKKIKRIFVIILILVLFLLVNVQEVFSALFNYDKWGIDKAKDHICYSVLSKSSNLSYSAKYQRDEDKGNDKYIECGISKLEDKEVSITFRLEAVVQTTSFIYSDKSTYIQARKAGDGDKSAYPKYKLVEIYENGGYSLYKQGNEEKVHITAQYGVSDGIFYYDTKLTIKTDEAFDIYINGNNENILLLKFIGYTGEAKKEMELDEELKDAWKKTPEEASKEGTYGRMLYLQSCLENGKWNKIEKMDANTRKSWLMTIGQARDEKTKEKFRNGINALSKLVDADNASEDEKAEKEKEYQEDLKKNQEEAQKKANQRKSTLKKLSAKFDSTNETRKDDAVFNDVLSDVSVYTPGGISEGDADTVKKKIGTILGVITNLGIVISVLMLAAIGVKYILGSVDEKAEYKKDMIPYLIGATLLLSITTVVKILQTIGQDINNI